MLIPTTTTTPSPAVHGHNNTNLPSYCRRSAFLKKELLLHIPVYPDPSKKKISVMVCMRYRRAAVIFNKKEKKKKERKKKKKTRTIFSYRNWFFECITIRN